MFFKHLQKRKQLLSDAEFTRLYNLYLLSEQICWNNFFYSLEHPLLFRCGYLANLVLLIPFFIWLCHFILLLLLHAIIGTIMGILKGISVANEVSLPFLIDVYTFLSLSIKNSILSTKKAYKKVFTKKKYKQWRSRLFNSLPEILKKEIKKRKKIKKNKKQ